ncbi:MAG TPA: SemiSWEET transporter [Thermoanaerobaculia bacterium]|nr:SemiSWEET transporter [Thermoanaerobaculia bacterium]
MKTWITVIGSLSAIGTTAAWLPQVVRTWRTRAAEDFSWSYLALFSSGVAGWIVYGFLRKDFVVIAANVVTLLLVLTVLFVKIREETPGG